MGVFLVVNMKQMQQHTIEKYRKGYLRSQQNRQDIISNTLLLQFKFDERKMSI